MDYSAMTGSDHGLPSFYQPTIGGNPAEPQQEELEQQQQQQQVGGGGVTGTPSRYEAQKRRDWNTFGQYLKNHRPPLTLARCSGAHVLEFLRYLDQFGKTKVHTPACPFFGHPQPPAPCACPLRQAWGSLDALVGRLRAAFEENGGKPEANPFGARAVHLYLREVRQLQAKARGIAYDKKKRKRPSSKQQQQQHQQQEEQDENTSTTHAPAASMSAASTSASSSMQRQHGYYAAMEIPNYDHILHPYGPPL